VEDDVPDWAKHESERERPAETGGPYAPRKRMDPYLRLFCRASLRIRSRGGNPSPCVAFGAATDEPDRDPDPLPAPAPDRRLTEPVLRHLFRKSFSTYRHSRSSVPKSIEAGDELQSVQARLLLQGLTNLYELPTLRARSWSSIDMVRL
jgi:hypothetical protein